MSVKSNRSLSLVDGAADSSRAVHTTFVSDVKAVQHVLGPEERLLAVLHGSVESKPITWVATTRRLIVLHAAHPEREIVHVSHAAVTCVEMRSDPLGTAIRVRATGRQLVLHTLDAAQATSFSSLLRERAGIGIAHTPAPRRMLDASVRGSHPVSAQQLR